MRLGAELAVSEINERGGVRGRLIELQPADDRGQAETAMQLARRFRDDRSVVAVIGHADDVTTLAAAPFYGSGSDPVAVVTPSATGSEVGLAGQHVFRVCPDDIAHAGSLADFAHGELNIGTVATLYQNDPDSRATSAAFRSKFAALGGRIVAEDPFSDALPSFEPYLSRVARRGGVGALLIVGGGVTSMRSILATFDTVGFQPTILSDSDLLPFLSAEEDALEGTFFSTAYLPERGGARNASFVTAFRRAHGGQLPDPVAAAAYDIVYMIVRAAAAVGPDRARIRDYLAGIGTETEPFEGVTGTIAFDEHGNLTRKDVDIGVVRAGTLVPASER